MAGTSLGKYYLTIIPSFEGGSFAKLGNQITGQVDGKAQGEKIGKSVTGGVTSGLSALKVAAGTMLGNALSAGIGYLVDFAGEAVAASDATDKFKSTLTFAGIDASGIEKLTASTREYADKTIYDLSDIQNITAQLASNGVANYDKLAEAAGNLNAVAGGNKETFKSVGMVLTQTAGAGKLTAENWRQLSDAIPGAAGPIKQALQDMGAYTGDFAEAMRKGEISSDEFNQALMTLGFQDAAVEASTSTATMEGALGNLQAAFVGLMSDGFGAIKPAITDFIGTIADGVTQIPAMVATVGEAISPFVDAFMQGLAPIGEFLSANVLPAFQMLGDALMSLGEVALPILLPLLEGIMTVLGELGGILGQVIGVTLELVINCVTLIVESLTSFLGWMGETFGPFWTDTLLPALQVAWEAITTAIQVAIEFIQGFIDGFIAIVGPAWDVFWQGVGSVVETVWGMIQTVVETVMGVIQGIIDVVMGLISGNWEQAWNGIKGIGESIWNGIKGIVEGAINAVKGVIDTVLGTIKSLWDNAWNAVKDFVQDAWDGICNAVSDGIDNILNWFANLPGNILSALGDLGGLLVNAGKSIIDGFLNGLKAAWDGVCSFIGGIGDWIASHKGPLSYDARLLIPAGEAIIGGLGSSMDREFRAVLGKVDTYGSQISRKLSGEIAPTLNYQLDSTLRGGRSVAGDVYDGMDAALAKRADQRPVYLVVDGKVLGRVLSGPVDEAFALSAVRAHVEV